MWKQTRWPDYTCTSSADQTNGCHGDRVNKPRGVKTEAFTMWSPSPFEFLCNQQTQDQNLWLLIWWKKLKGIHTQGGLILRLQPADGEVVWFSSYMYMYVSTIGCLEVPYHVPEWVDIYFAQYLTTQWNCVCWLFPDPPPAPLSCKQHHLGRECPKFSTSCLKVKKYPLRWQLPSNQTGRVSGMGIQGCVTHSRG